MRKISMVTIVAALCACSGDDKSSADSGATTSSTTATGTTGTTGTTATGTTGTTATGTTGTTGTTATGTTGTTATGTTGTTGAVPCDDTRPPVFLVHGITASGSRFAPLLDYMTSNGYCLDRVFAHDYASLYHFDSDPYVLDWRKGSGMFELLDAAVDEVLAETGADKVDFIGHSLGGLAGYTYMADPDHAAKVNRYAHVASFANFQPAGPKGEVPTLNIYGTAEGVIDPMFMGEIPGATNVVLDGADHYQALYRADAFAEIYKFLNDGEEPVAEVLPQAEPIEVSGKALVFMDNTPLEGASIDIYEVDPATGFRVDAVPAAEFVVAADGAWGPFEAAPETTYEFVATPTDGAPTVHVYTPPFVRSTNLFYLSTMANYPSASLLVWGAAPMDQPQTNLFTFVSFQSVMADRDTISVGGVDLTSEDLFSSSKNIWAFGSYDDGDQVSSLDADPLFADFTTFNGVDLYLPADVPTTINVTMNDRSLNVSSWPANENHLVYAVLR